MTSQNTKYQNIAVAGAGYVGLAMATLLGRFAQMSIVDVVPDKVALINQGTSPLRDPEIESTLSALVKSGALQATTCAEKGYAQADLVIIATPTNYDEDTNSFDTSSIEAAISAVRNVNKTAWIVIKSTVPVGYTSHLVRNLQDTRIFFCPEFLREGKALYDNLHPSRFIAGIPEESTQMLAAANAFIHLLQTAADEQNIPSLICNSTEAEAIKLFANTYLALRVSYFNELDTYAAKNNLDSKKIIEGICYDPRIGNHYNNPSFGYGGYCLPKDSKQLLANYENIPQEIMSAVVAANDTRKDFISSEIYELVTDMQNPKVGIYRLAMKTGSDNFRQSSIQGIISRLNDLGINMIIYEPSLTEDVYEDIPIVKDLQSFKDAADVIVANRFTRELQDVDYKVYTRDLFECD